MESVRKHRGIKIVTAKKGTICYLNQIITQQNFSQQNRLLSRNFNT